MQNDFIKYLRSETKKISCAVLIAMVILSLLLSALLLKSLEDEESNKAITYFCVVQCVPTIFLAFTVLMSYQNEKFAELLSLSIIIPTLIIVFLSYQTESFNLDKDSRNFQLWLLSIESFVLVIIFPIDYLIHLIIRQSFYWLCFIYTMTKRVQYNENVTSPAGIICVTFCYVMILEFIVYINHKAKAKLFMQLKMSAM